MNERLKLAINKINREIFKKYKKTQFFEFSFLSGQFKNELITE